MADSEDTKVEIIWPQFYAEASMNTMNKFSRAIAHICKSAAILGDDEVEFAVDGINVLQTSIVEEIFQDFGVELAHEHHKDEDGKRWTRFCADVTGLKKLLEDGGEIWE